MSICSSLQIKLVDSSYSLPRYQPFKPKYQEIKHQAFEKRLYIQNTNLYMCLWVRKVMPDLFRVVSVQGSINPCNSWQHADTSLDFFQVQIRLKSQHTVKILFWKSTSNTQVLQNYSLSSMRERGRGKWGDRRWDGIWKELEWARKGRREKRWIRGDKKLYEKEKDTGKWDIYFIMRRTLHTKCQNLLIYLFLNF